MSEQDKRASQDESVELEQMLAAERDRKRRVRKELFSWIRTFAIAVAAALLVRTFVFTPALVNGPSMQDTLHTGQMMAVLKASYWFRGPARGEVVFCHYPGWEEDCVKRVIGLPGERLRIEDSVVYIDDQPLDEPYLTRPETADFPEVTIEQGCYFVMGDHRARSTDSRVVGALEEKQIQGHCLAIMWPVGEWKVIR